MIDKINEIIAKYEDNEKKLSSPEYINDFNKIKEISKEQSKLKDLYTESSEYKKIINNLFNSKVMLNDKEIDSETKELLEMEIKDLEEQILQKEKKLKILLIPKDKDDEKNAIIEIRGAAGGDEAKIFAGDLFRMYQRFLEKNNWKIEILEDDRSEMGGYNLISFFVKGKNVYKTLKYEIGAHRVQRIPETETNGRIHTSTATVLVMPEIDNQDSEVQIDENDLRIDVFRSGGAGGQSVNTTDSAVRITHIPTNIVVTCQDERSQHGNKEKAMKVLRAKIYDLEQEKKNKEESNIRKKVGSGDRSERIRTYNYPQNRVTDHRINLTLNKLDKIMEGNLEELIKNLIDEDNKIKMSDK